MLTHRPISQTARIGHGLIIKMPKMTVITPSSTSIHERFLPTCLKNALTQMKFSSKISRNLNNLVRAKTAAIGFNIKVQFVTSTMPGDPDTFSKIVESFNERSLQWVTLQSIETNQSVLLLTTQSLVKRLANG